MRVTIERRILGVTIDQQECTIVVWAPNKKNVVVVLEEGQKIPLRENEHGFWIGKTDALFEGQRYKIGIDEQLILPDPASVYQPQGVHGYSEVVNLQSYQWKDRTWRNLTLEEYIIYELHVGTFTEEGTFDALVSKLDYLIDLGINAIELMPVAQFPGGRNWGYDGVFPFAVQNSYGGPRGLQRLVDACHEKKMAVILDVVYNHLGPEGNYLEAYGPYFTDKYHTPWGKAVNVDDAYSDGVRQYIIDNMLMWLRDFHIDTLRLDAVHAIKDFGAEHILSAMREAADKLSHLTGRSYYLIGECDLNDVRYIREIADGGYGLHGQWIDEFHHALRVSAGEARRGYYADFESVTHLAKSFTDAYVYDGIYSPHRKKTFGNKAIGARGEQFVVFSQNHDQVGNRMFGERSSVLYSSGLQKVMTTAVLAAPYLPMLFMGEEYGEQNPFQYFVSHTDAKLAKAVREGRQKEFEQFHTGEEAPDPMSIKTYERAKLNWSLLDSGAHKEILQFYKTLITLRKSHSAWHTLDRSRIKAAVFADQQSLVVNRWDENESLFFLFNFSTRTQDITLNFKEHLVKIFDTESGIVMQEQMAVDKSPVGKIQLGAESASVFQMKSAKNHDKGI
ncbi:MAG TPA: malto-oligosyltrehalose trehalohydrolase [Pseudosphingobacterium sp.]|nr:malto-oligosyltrehalose trehalohydrolase [Pseudosphingobacterium sp.]